jgi:nucleotide-binding universal stress UspA family protein
MTAIERGPSRADTTSLRRIVVACTDTYGSRAALAWAEADSVLSGRRIVLCRTYPSGTAGALLPPPAAIGPLEIVDPVFAGQVRQLRGRLGADRIEVRIRFGSLVDQLISTTEPTDLLVTEAAPPGTTGLAVTLGAHASATVVAVRPTAPRTTVAGPFAGHVVVGVDGAGRDSGPIRFAFDYAERHGKPLTAVHADEPDGAGLWIDDQFLEIHPLGHTFGLDMLDAAVAAAHANHPRVAIRRAVMHQPATAALVRASAGALLLVVGDRGRGPIARHLLGSVSRHVLTHGRCTVAVVHGAQATPAAAAF